MGSANEIVLTDAGASISEARGRGIFALIATVITISSVLSTVLSVHLLSLLQARGIGLSAAVAFGAIIGPSQVGARTVEMFVARFHHPIWTKLASTSLVALGIALLWTGLPVISAALVLYGAGIGLEFIARGTLPLAVFGAADYPAIMGRIARPSSGGAGRGSDHRSRTGRGRWLRGNVSGPDIDRNRQCAALGWVVHIA